MLMLVTLAAIAACEGSSNTVRPPSNAPPETTIDRPLFGAIFPESTEVTFVGQSTDQEDGPLPAAALAWSSSIDGPLGIGDSITVPRLSAGGHLITLRGTDSEGSAGDATTVVVIPRSAGGPPALLRIARGLSAPVFLTHAPGDSTRLFVVEKTGKIRVIRNGVLLPTAFLDLGDSVSSGSEQGLLGLAFAPDYRTSGRFYVSYTSPRGAQSGGTSVVERYLVTNKPDLADPGSGRRLLTVDQPFSNHNGGMIAFGPDGYLYFGLGDGGSGGDPLGTGQDRSDLLGSLLRLDVSGPAGYVIPPGNPYAGGGANRPELWNYGLRNPWRFSFDRETGDLYIGDVGQNAHEEIDVQPAASAGGENYGWNIMEGLSCYGASSCNQAGLTLPVLDYPHGQGCSVTGGYVYRGSVIPSLRGRYLYGDYCSGWIRSFRYQGGQAQDPQTHASLATAGSLTSFGEDAAGELYVLTQGGSVYRIVPQ
jgi:glucose/arabinose dehydrogenase